MNFMGMGIKENHRGTLCTTLVALLFLTLVGGCTGQQVTEQAATPEKPLNVLFILTDDQAPDTVSAFGNANINTPSLDSLAEQGMRFSHVFNAGCL